MKLKQLLEQLNQLAKERPEALEMEVVGNKYRKGKDDPSSIIDIELREKKYDYKVYIWQE